MNLKELKLSQIDKKSQIILFDQEWAFVDSCHSLQELKKPIRVFEELFFLDGLQDQLTALEIGQKLHLYCLWASFFGRESYYDFQIKKVVLDDKFFFALTAFDFKDQYEKLIDLQQERNVSSIKKSELQRKYDKVEEEKEVIERLYKEGSSDSPREFVFIKTDLMWVNVDMNTILYFEAYGDYIKVHTLEKTYVIYNRMKNVEEKLSEKDFIRIHRSYIVRIDKIQNIETSNLQINDKILPMGNMYRKDLLDKINHF